MELDGCEQPPRQPTHCPCTVAWSSLLYLVGESLFHPRARGPWKMLLLPALLTLGLSTPGGLGNPPGLCCFVPGSGDFGGRRCRATGRVSCIAIRYCVHGPVRCQRHILLHAKQKGVVSDEAGGNSERSGIIIKIRKIFSKTDEKEADTPSPREGRITFDSLRLKMARAMSNVNVFRSRDEWVVACTKARVGPGQIVPCVVNGLDIVIFASRDGTRLDAFANSCPHLGSPFDLATVERKPVVQEKGRSGDGTGDGCVDCIVCPVHQTAFEIQSGQVQGEWCPHPPILGSIMGYVKPKQSLVKFAVRLRGKNVEVRVSTSVDRVGLGDEGPTGLTGIK